MTDPTTIVESVTTVVTVASVICAVLPPPKTATGRMIRAVIEIAAVNIGRAKRRIR